MASGEEVCVYVRLRGEGVLVYRAAIGVRMGPDTVRLLLQESYNPEDEDWEFRPGSVVRVERRQPEDSDELIAISSVG